MNDTAKMAGSPRRPRVAIFCDDEAWGGIVTYCVMLARELPAHGVDVVLVAPRASEWHAAAAAEGVTVLVPAPPSPTAPVALVRTTTAAIRSRLAAWYRRLTPMQVRWALGAFRELREIRRVLAALPVDLIHVQSAGGEVAALAARLRAPRVPVVTTLHFPPTMVAIERRRSLTWRLLCSLNMRAADAVIAVAQVTLTEWQRFPGGGHAGRRARVIHNGTTIPTISPTRVEARAALGLATDTTVILNVAAMVAYKDHGTLLIAASQLREHTENFEVLLAGDGPCRDALIQQAAALGLARRIRFLGHRTDTATLFAAADLYVQSSVEEAFPMVLLEAGLQEVPIVATKVGGVQELLTNGETALLVPAGQPEAMADAILATLTERDAATTRTARLSARIRESFLSEAMLTQTAARYRELLKITA